jgi:hypothetical protein
MEKNDIRKLMQIPIALTPCRRSDCDRWRVGSASRYGKQGNPISPRYSKSRTRDLDHFLHNTYLESTIIP